MPKAKKYTELIGVSDNTHGTFTQIATPLRENKINIVGYCAYEWGGEAAFRLIINNNTAAHKILSDYGWTVSENPTVLWESSNRPGTLEKATDALTNAGVNIYSTYTTAKTGGRKAIVAFTTNDVQTTYNVLNNV